MLVVDGVLNLLGILSLTCSCFSKLTINMIESNLIDQFRNIKIQRKTIDHIARLRRIITEFVGFIPQSLVLRSIFLGLILIIRSKLVYHLFGCNIRSEGTSCGGNLIISSILSRPHLPFMYLRVSMVTC